MGRGMIWLLAFASPFWSRFTGLRAPSKSRGKSAARFTSIFRNAK
jgi:hypothetical protein